MDNLRAGRTPPGLLISLAQDLVSGKERHERMQIAHMLEDEIERRGLQARYAMALVVIVLGESQKTLLDIGRAPSDEDLFALIRATPEHRARAFLEAMKA